MSYIYNYIIKEEQQENSFSQFGTLAHELLELWAKGKLETYELLQEYENRYDTYVTEPFPKLKNGKSMGDTYYLDGYNYFANFNGISDIGDYEIIGVEEHFEIQMGDFVFNGFIDLILKDAEGNVCILDWKSKNGFKDDAEEAEYRRQLYLYSAYIYEKYGVYPSKTMFYCFRKQQKYEKNFDLEAYNSSIKWMFDTVAKIRELFKCYDWFFCSSICSYKHVCQIKKEMETNKEFAKIIKDLKKEDKVVKDDC